MKILLVDDSKIERELTGNVLCERGHKVQVAENKEQALDAIRKHPEIEVMVLDIILPDWSGVEDTLMIVNEFGKTVIIHTCHGYLEVLDKLRPHVRAIVSKSYESEELIEALERLE